MTSPHKCSSFEHTQFILGSCVCQESGYSPVVCLLIVLQAQVRVSGKLSCLKVGLSWLPQVGSRNKVPTYHPARDRLNSRTVFRSLLHPVSPGGLCAFVGRQENLLVWSETVPSRTEPDKGVVAVGFSWRRELFRHVLYVHSTGQKAA